VAERVIEFFARPRPAGVSVAFPQLTDREHEILDLVAQGRSNSIIASRLRISDKTVRNHVSSIFTKLAVADRAQAIVRARTAGMGGASS
jgi:DNA-binding NarL/FixJ family response regulator